MKKIKKHVKKGTIKTMKMLGSDGKLRTISYDPEKGHLMVVGYAKDFQDKIRVTNTQNQLSAQELIDLVDEEMRDDELLYEPSDKVQKLFRQGMFDGGRK